MTLEELFWSVWAMLGVIGGIFLVSLACFYYMNRHLGPRYCTSCKEEIERLTKR